MPSLALADHQIALIERPVDSNIFLEGPAGAGKTTAGVERLLHLLDSGVPAGSILVIVPQRTLAVPYYDALRRAVVCAGGQVAIYTIGGLAQRMVDLYWPLVAQEAGFAHPDQPPTFLTLETAQYYMARLVRPLLDQGAFETVVIDRNRLYSQILDNLNKAAVVGFPHTQIGDRLKAAWGGEQSQRRVYDDAQLCATRFRDYCLAHNLLDFSLQLEVFTHHLWPRSFCRDTLQNTYQHLIADNVEEDTPVAHDLLREWLPQFRSALLIYDHLAGYRRFLGADPESARALSELCDTRITFMDSFVTSPDLRAFGAEVSRSLNRPVETVQGDVREVLAFKQHRYHPQMLDWIASEIAGLVHEQDVPPEEIAVLSPFLSSALRFSLMNRLQQHRVPVRSHRPSRSLREEPATHCLLTLAAIAHPDWGICPTRFDVAYALMQALDAMDLVRAQLLAGVAYRVREHTPALRSFDEINLEMQERVTFVMGGRYEVLRAWLQEAINNQASELDHFLSRLFGEVLSQEGFGFHRNYDAGRVASNLIESVQKFRWGTGNNPAQPGNEEPKPLGQEYVQMVQDGVIAAQYVGEWQLQPEGAVLLAPAYTFVIGNRPVDYQFWLNVGGRGWWERLYQPLTHPYVLNRHWPEDGIWSDTDEVAARQEALYRLSMGLIGRCRRRITLGLSELGEQGDEQRGALLQAVQRVLRRLPAQSTGQRSG